LNRIVLLLQEHAGDLGAFLANDPRGKKTTEFLGAVAQRLQKEQELVLRELASLRKNVEHVRDIVAVQQGYATISGVIESVNVTELVEDTLRINAGGLERSQVHVQRKYSPVAPILTDKHKVLQILINLVHNAKHACDDSGRSDKLLTVAVQQEADKISVFVSDNGVGIPAENLDLIFSHGFTTRKNGHGFGLHSGALAARELGGMLNVQSDGRDKGATFRLELPIALNKCRATAHP
jgi:C4-dicarboxylate-specific signal transduction histidine kinase